MEPRSEKSNLGATGICVPRIVFGTSAMGNLYQRLAYKQKLAIAAEWFKHVEQPVAIDSAGKYGAGLALEMIARTLTDLGIEPDGVVISNKLAWKRVPLEGSEPTFEPGVWHGIGHDAEQHISYKGILDCWQQGCELLDPYKPQLVSVHDPDEYLNAACDTRARESCFQELLEAYRGLAELKTKGEVAAVGVGCKDWQTIRDLTDRVELDWIMLACSLTVYTHPPELLEYVDSLRQKGVAIINSAVFNAGFLVGGDFFNYRKPDPASDASLFAWRASFLQVCDDYNVEPADACIEFGFCIPGIAAVALNTSNPQRVAKNVKSVQAKAPKEFWAALKRNGLINPSFPYLG